ncbi:hypothetical protein LY76DRAFT_598545 [Colletotrichum caudatum]|nr:hypothetical protein LY76DRAFT_598545 [Colletotrichum caudatum]
MTPPVTFFIQIPSFLVALHSLMSQCSEYEVSQALILYGQLSDFLQMRCNTFWPGSLPIGHIQPSAPPRQNAAIHRSQIRHIGARFSASGVWNDALVNSRLSNSAFARLAGRTKEFRECGQYRFLDVASQRKSREGTERVNPFNVSIEAWDWWVLTKVDTDTDDHKMRHWLRANKDMLRISIQFTYKLP